MNQAAFLVKASSLQPQYSVYYYTSMTRTADKLTLCRHAHSWMEYVEGLKAVGESCKAPSKISLQNFIRELKM